MRRATILIAGLVLATAGCGGAAPPSTGASGTPEPSAATPAPATTAPTSTTMLIPATVTFDGTTCTYLGPTVVPFGSVIEWTFETTATTADQRASWELISFDAKHDATWEEIVAWAAENTLAREGPVGWLPPWAIDRLGRSIAETDRGEPMVTRVRSRPVLVACGVGGVDAGNTETVLPAKLIQVLQG